MDYKRAKEIVSSDVMVNVTYNKTPVYIEIVNTDQETASIHAINQPQLSQQVAISALQEVDE